MPKPLHFLFLEDDPEDFEIVEHFLKQEGLNFHSTVVSTSEQYCNALDKEDFDLIVSDHSIQLFNSGDALAIRNKKNILTPFIVLSGTIQEEYAVSLIRNGASDYILKDRLQRLPTAIMQAIEKRKLLEEKLKAEKELIKSNERFELAARATSDTIWDWNIAADKMFIADERLTDNKPTKKSASINGWLNNIHPEDKRRVTESLANIVNNTLQKTWVEEYRYINGNGIIATVVNKGIILRDIQGKPYRMVGAIQDISELTVRDKELKEFSFIISHNLHSPLSNLLAILKIIDPSELSQHNSNLLKMMEKSTIDLKQLVDHLSHALVIKNKPVYVQEVNIHQCFAKAKQMLQFEIKELNPQIAIDFKMPMPKTKAPYLESIFINLLSNSLKFHSPTRRLDIKITSERIDKKKTKITFSDNGIGIDLGRNKDKLFGLYQRFHSLGEGLGLGLYLIKTQITALGGSISVESEVDKGTSFIITL